MKNWIIHYIIDCRLFPEDFVCTKEEEKLKKEVELHLNRCLTLLIRDATEDGHFEAYANDAMSLKQKMKKKLNPHLRGSR